MALRLEDYMQWPEIEALEYAECGRPETVLGPRMIGKSHVLVTALFREADSVKVKVLDTKKEYSMEKMEEMGYYAVLIPAKKIPSYHFLVKRGKEQEEMPDPYAMESQIDGLDMNRFNHGIHDTIYQKLGAHPMTLEGTRGTYFAVW